MKPDLSTIPAPERSTEARKPLTRRETIELAVRQAGKCGCGCAVKLNALTEGVIDEHLISLAAGGTNDLANRALFRSPCATAKTKGDKAVIGSVRRIEARDNGTRRARRPIPKAKNAWPPRGSQKLQSRGFDKPRGMGEGG